jgi:hypothetical protein
MNCFDFNNFGSPIIKGWSNEDMMFDQEDDTSVYSFLKGRQTFPVIGFEEEPQDQTFDFGLNWLIEQDRNQLFGTQALKSKHRASSFNVMAEEGRLAASHFSQLCDLEEEESLPEVKKPLAKAEKAPKSKAMSVKSTKTRITQKKDLNQKIAKLNAKNNSAKDKKES